MIKTQQQIINDGYQALLSSLGPVETIRFLQHFNLGAGDYTQERRAYPAPSLDTIAEEMEILPAPNLDQYEEII
ncbi:hypothetical protein IQE94_01010 [Synechocystis sp. PCC 7339]|uniref:hypothetical protein n=1 Tax=unclassified Synechocystis TaxID=2640012 RepID=UPI001BAE6016|nr:MULTISPECIES: hypothetical protein [unclassified Synechocystis]QUS60782.1 hypothetical protein HTZ78_08945 [Synechocystis sp. PCC 7338]UAJ72971.1 hypothetical protein IQE94_01010 [Synechocystis sp. PCC 7339]